MLQSRTKDTQEQWISKGWHSLGSCGGCAMVMDERRTEYTNVYYHAQDPSGAERIGGQLGFVYPREFSPIDKPETALQKRAFI